MGKFGNPPGLGPGDRRFKSDRPDWTPPSGKAFKRCFLINAAPEPSTPRGRGVAAARRTFNPTGGGSNPSGPIDRSIDRPVAQRKSPRPITGRRGFNSPRADSRASVVFSPGTQVLAAAHPALNRAGEGSSPSGPIRNSRHRWSSGEDTAPVMRRRGFESHPVLSLFDNPVTVKCAHDVAAAYRLAMADVRVRLPLGTSLLPTDRGTVQDRTRQTGRGKAWQSAWFGTRRPPVRIRPPRLKHWRHNGVLQSPQSPLHNFQGGGTGRRTRLLTGPLGVRLPPLEPLTRSRRSRRKGEPIGDGSRLESGRAMSLGGSTPPPSAALLLSLRGVRSTAGPLPSKQATRARLPHPALFVPVPFRCAPGPAAGAPSGVVSAGRNPRL